MEDLNAKIYKFLKENLTIETSINESTSFFSENKTINLETRMVLKDPKTKETSIISTSYSDFAIEK